MNFYKAHKADFRDKKNSFGAYLVLKEFEKSMLEKVEKMKGVYGGFPNSSYLVSLGEELYLGNVYMFNALFREFVLYTTQKYIQTYNAKAVIEPGSGTGINLFSLFTHSNLDFIKGGELCPNAYQLSNTLAKDFSVSSEFVPFSFYDKDGIKKLCNYKKKYILITTHATEQLPSLPDSFIQGIIDLKNPPEAVLHFEPVQFQEEKSVFAKRCKRYSEINLYNQDLYDKLKKSEKKKQVEILDVQKYVLGLSAFNPTSFIAWRPR